ncbi:MAG: hypothetical protein Rpha_2168 [Candidatus Ruthia sp. Apha_13_S6]|nr:hypothetical protein [Candidatus Ruthia sp. Apha_13_S6]
MVLPRTDVEIECWLGYGDDLYNKGSFEVDEVITSGISVLLQKALGLTSHSNQSRTHANIQ